MKAEIEDEIARFNEVQRIEGKRISATYEPSKRYLSLEIVLDPETGWGCRCTYLPTTSSKAETRAALRMLMKPAPERAAQKYTWSSHINGAPR